MAEGYCVKCKARKPIAEAVEEIMKNGRKAIKGRCPDCGAVMFKTLGGKGTSVLPGPDEPRQDGSEEDVQDSSEVQESDTPEAKPDPETPSVG